MKLRCSRSVGNLKTRYSLQLTVAHPFENHLKFLTKLNIEALNFMFYVALGAFMVTVVVVGGGPEPGVLACEAISRSNETNVA